jgi:hypothetical protein
MSKIDTSVVWGPTLLGRRAFAVGAPFDMQPAEIELLIGMVVSVGGATWIIRGLVRNIPQQQIRTGDPIELLVVGPRSAPSRGNSGA